MYRHSGPKNHFIFITTKNTQANVSHVSVVSHNCFYYNSKPECAIPDDNVSVNMVRLQPFWRLYIAYRSGRELQGCSKVG